MGLKVVTSSEQPVATSPVADQNESSVLNEVIGQIYECAIDPGQWNDTLKLLVGRLAPPRWNVAMLLQDWQNPPSGRFIGTTGLEETSRSIYLSTFAGRNPWVQRLGNLPLGTVADTDELMPKSELLESPLYKDFLSRWNIQRAIAVVLERRERSILGFVMPGPPDHDLENLKRDLRLLFPHIQRALRISHALGEANLRAHAAEAALDRAREAIVTLTPKLKIVNTNAKARTLADTGWISLKTRGFAFADTKAQARLIELARKPAPASAVFKIANPQGQELPVMAACLPAHSTPVLGGTIEGAGLLISIGSGAQGSPVESEHLSAWFGLTPAEAKLTAALATGDTLKDFAARRAVSMNAVRFLLKGIYRKTGAASQAELIGRVRDLPTN